MQLSDQQIRMLRYAVEQRLLWKHADLRLVSSCLLVRLRLIHSMVYR